MLRKNVFDAVDNGTEYYEFDPDRGEWTEDLFHAKMLQIAEVIGTGIQNGADIVALQEIENTNVLETLQTEGVKNLGYLYSALAPAPGAAVNTALLSRFPISGIRSHEIQMEGSEGLRNILEVEIEVTDEKLYLLNNHWKSKSGGPMETEPLRIAAAGLIKRRIQQIQAGDPDADIVVCGDLNENHDEFVRVEGTYPTALVPAEDAEVRPAEGSLSITGNQASLFVEGEEGEAVLYSPWFAYREQWGINDTGPGGSYLYNGSWETIDHFLLGRGLFDDIGFQYKEFRIIMEDFMINERGVPLRWFPDTMTGYSDHLPILIELELRTREK